MINFDRDGEFAYEKVSIEDARKVLAGIPDPRPQPNWTKQRGQFRTERALPNTLTWMAQLPQGLRPFNLTRQYPRIANEICRRWKFASHCEHYMDQLLINYHGGRKRRGFSPQIITEIAGLAGHLTRRRPHRGSSARGWELRPFNA